jgi:hypothetical protein
MSTTQKPSNTKRNEKNSRNVSSFLSLSSTLCILTLHQVKDKYGSDLEEDDVESETDSEEAESEDEYGEELTPTVDAAILRTLARIKRKDPEIYNSEKGIFEGSGISFLYLRFALLICL